MSYANWRKEFEAPAKADARRAARRWNLEAETRIATVCADFKGRLGRAHGTCKGLTPDVGRAAIAALDEMIEATKPVRSPWLGRLSVAGGAPLPTTMMSHLTARDARHYKASGPIDLNDPPTTFRFRKPHMTDTERCPESRFIWMTFELDGGAASQDPGEVARQLGLARCKPNDYLYRIWLNVDAARLFVPSCLDAGLYEAWAPPPAAHAAPWGLTRDLTSGLPAKPELLTETVDHLKDLPPTAKLVSPVEPKQPVGAIRMDFAANRR
ncbi:MAG: hypothetical protein ACT4P2_15080 [Pseudomonadota bacterium]